MPKASFKQVNDEVAFDGLFVAALHQQVLFERELDEVPTGKRLSQPRIGDLPVNRTV